MMHGSGPLYPGQTCVKYGRSDLSLLLSDCCVAVACWCAPLLRYVDREFHLPSTLCDEGVGELQTFFFI